MNKAYFIVALILALSACTSNTVIKKPDDLIPKEQMVELLTEMMLATGAEGIRNAEGDRNIDYFPLVFAKYGIDSARFKRSNFYYTSRIDDYEEILSRVDARLKELRIEFDRERMRADSMMRPEDRIRPGDYDDY
jgi:hypothetical protein